MRGGLLLVVVLVLFGAADASAQQARPNIYVEVTANDPVGRRLGYELRSQIASSPLLALTDLDSEAWIRIAMVTVAADSNRGYNMTAYSFVITLANFDGSFDYFYSNWAGVCGADRVSQCARDLVTNVVGVRDDIIRAARN